MHNTLIRISVRSEGEKRRGNVIDLYQKQQRKKGKAKFKRKGKKKKETSILITFVERKRRVYDYAVFVEREWCRATYCQLKPSVKKKNGDRQSEKEKKASTFS